MKIFTVISACLAATAATAQDVASYDCVMDPSEIVLVSSPTGGVIAETFAGRGDLVTSGQVLAQLSSAVEEANVALLEARTDSTAALEAQTARRDLIKTRYERSLELRERNIISDDQLAEVSAELVAAESLVRQAELDRTVAQQELDRARVILAQRTIESPIDGIVVTRNTNAGEFLAQDDYVMSIISLDPLYIEAFLPIEVYDQVALGGTGIVKPNAPIGGTYQAEITIVDQVFDAASGTFGVRLEMANPDSALPAGQRCMLQFAPSG